jgi:hypothetical protein
MSSSLVGHRVPPSLKWPLFKKGLLFSKSSFKKIRVTPATAAAAFILAGMLSLSAPSEAREQPLAAQAKGTVATSELDLAGLSFYALEEDILALLGPPKSREIAPTAYIDEVLYYGGISIAIAGGQVWDIVATSPKFCTPSGICPGDSVDYVFNILGPTDILYSGESETAVYTTPDMGCSMNLDIVADAVSQIKLTCP